MGTIRIDFRTAGGTRAIRDLERFTTALERAVAASQSVPEGNQIFKGLVDEAKEASAVVRELANDFKAIQDAARGLGRIRLPRQSTPRATDGTAPTGDGGESTQRQAASLRDLTEAQVQFNQAAAQARERFQELRAAGVPLGDALEQISQEFQFSEREAKKLATQLTKLEATASQVQQPVEETRKSFSELVQEQVRAERQSQNVIQQFQELRAAGLSLDQALERLEGDFNLGADANVGRLVNELKRLETQSNQTLAAGGNLTELGIALKTSLVDIGVDAIRSFGQGLAGVVGESLSQFRGLDAALTNFAARSGQTREELASLEEEILRLAGITSQTPESVAETSVQLLQLGVAAEDVEGSLNGVIKLADVLGEDPVLTGKVLQTGVNVFGEFGTTTDNLSDKLNLLVNTTAAGSSEGLAEFLQLFQQAGGPAKLLGVDIDNLAVSFATLRDAGLSADVAATGLRTVFASIQAPIGQGAKVLEALNFNLADFQDSAGNLNVEELIRFFSTLSSEQLFQVFGREGISAITGLIDQLDTRFVQSAENIKTAQGSVDETLEVVNQSLERQRELLSGQVAEGLTAFGRSLGTVELAIVKFAQAIATAFGESFNALDLLNDAGEQLAATFEENPEIAEQLGAAFADLAEIAVEELAQIVQQINELVSSEEAIDGIVASLESFGQILTLLGDAAQFVVLLSNGLARLNADTTFIERVSVPFRILGELIRQSANAAQGLVTNLERLGIIDPPDPVAFQSVTAEIDAAAAAVQGYQDALNNITGPTDTGTGGAADVEADAEAAAKAAAEREAEIERQTQDELFAREQEFDRQKFAREQAFERQLQSEKLSFEDELETKKRDVERTIEADKRAFELEQENQKRAFEQQQQASKAAFERGLQNEERAFEAGLRAEEAAFNAQQQADEEAFQRNLQAQEQQIDRQVQLEFAENPRERRDLARQFAEEDARAAREEQLRGEFGIEQQREEFEAKQAADKEAFEATLEARRLAFEDVLQGKRLENELALEQEKIAFEDVLLQQAIANEDILLEKKKALLVPLDAEQAKFDTAQANRKFGFQQDEAKNQRNFDIAQRDFEIKYKDDIRKADVAASETVADNIRRGAADAKTLIESARIQQSSTNSRGQFDGSTPSLRSGGTLQPFELAKVHRDEYIVPGQQGATVISQVRSRAIQAAAMAKANEMASTQQRLMAGMLKEIQRLRSDIASRPIPRMDVVQNYNATPSAGRGVESLLGYFDLIKI